MNLPSFCVDRDAVLKDPSNSIKWRYGIPNYTKVNSLFEKHKTTDHQPGSLEFIVQNIVKNWEKGIQIILIILSNLYFHKYLIHRYHFRNSTNLSYSTDTKSINLDILFNLFKDINSI